MNSMLLFTVDHAAKITLLYTTVSSSVYSNSSCSFAAFFFEDGSASARLFLNSNESPSSEREQYPEASELLRGRK